MQILHFVQDDLVLWLVNMMTYSPILLVPTVLRGNAYRAKNSAARVDARPPTPCLVPVCSV